MGDRNIHISGAFGVISAIATVAAELILEGSVSLRPVATGVTGAFAAWVVLTLGMQIFRRFRPAQDLVLPASTSSDGLQAPSKYRGHPFIHLTPSALIGTLKGKTSLEADEISSRYRDFALKVEGVVSDVEARFGNVVVMLRHHPPDSGEHESCYLVLYFEKKLLPQLRVLTRGDCVHATGVINSISSSWLRLNE
ncbi:MAG: hypothetical protein F4185_01080 [Chloroflexi bacterium]|nr:hypothetical protein [Chloroflexota bacterium]MYF64610.1 hypothetical protein [Chloroflexota bacterium]MYK34341.1 hypothetical protein [Chloroflexota bacterium]